MFGHLNIHFYLTFLPVILDLKKDVCATAASSVVEGLPVLAMALHLTVCIYFLIFHSSQCVCLFYPQLCVTAKQWLMGAIFISAEC